MMGPMTEIIVGGSEEKGKERSTLLGPDATICHVSSDLAGVMSSAVLSVQVR